MARRFVGINDREAIQGMFGNTAVGANVKTVAAPGAAFDKKFFLYCTGGPEPIHARRYRIRFTRRIAVFDIFLGRFNKREDRFLDESSTPKFRFFAHDSKRSDHIAPGGVIT
jgi:hypothetical protein